MPNSDPGFSVSWMTSSFSSRPGQRLIHVRSASRTGYFDFGVNRFNKGAFDGPLKTYRPRGFVRAQCHKL